MTAPPLLCARQQNGSNAIGYRLLAGTGLSAIPASGVTISSSLEAGTGNNNMNNMVRYGNEVFVWHRNQIYKIDTSGDTWSTASPAYTVSDMESTTSYAYHSGLYNISIGGTPCLIGFYTKASTNISKALVYNGSTWTGTDMTGSQNWTMWNPTEMIVYRGVVFGAANYGAKIWSWNPDGNIYTDVDSTNRDEFQISWAVLGGELYLVRGTGNSVPRNLIIQRLSSGALVTAVATVGTGSTGTLTDDGGRSELVAFGGSLYLFCTGRISGETYDGLRVYKYTTSGGLISSSTESDLTSSVVPTGWRPGAVDNGFATNASIIAFVDYDTNPVSPSMYFVLSKDKTSLSWLGATWNGDSSLITEDGTIGAYGLVFTQTKDGGGQRWWTEGSLNVQVTGLSTGTGGMSISYKAYGASGSSDKTVKFYYSFNEEPPVAQCTLTGSATGGSSSRNGNQIDNVDADDGVTTYTATWDFLTDGGFIGGRANVKARIKE